MKLDVTSQATSDFKNRTYTGWNNSSKSKPQQIDCFSSINGQSISQSKSFLNKMGSENQSYSMKSLTANGNIQVIDDFNSSD